MVMNPSLIQMDLAAAYQADHSRPRRFRKPRS